MTQSAEGLRLNFQGALEQEFRDEYYEKSLNSLRLSLVLGAALYGLFGVLDAWIFPETKSAVSPRNVPVSTQVAWGIPFRRRTWRLT